MNRTVYIYRILLATLIALVSCTGVDVQTPTLSSVTDYPVSLSTYASNGTRISTDGSALSWESDDVLKISALAADKSLATSELSVYEIDDTDPSSASFTGFVSMLSVPEYCYFTYPSSSATSVDASTGRIKFQYNSQTGLHQPFLYARCDYNPEGMNAVLKHAGAVLELTIQVPDVATVTFAGNNLENIYPIEIDPQTDELFFSAESGVQITVPVQADGKTYICVPPVNLSEGFSLILSKSDGTNMIKTYSSDGSLTGGYDFSQKVGSIIPITISGEFSQFAVTSTSLSAKHTKSGSRLTGTAVSFVINKTGASNKIIEEWGANLVNTDGIVVRTVSYTNATPISGQTVTMNVANNWKLLPEGTYIFTPYYKMYGSKVSLPSQVVTVSDPGVWLTLNGNTSYDKYKAGNVSGANSHNADIIEGVSISTNVDNSIIDSYSAVLDGTNLGVGYATTSSSEFKASFGNIQKTEKRSYQFDVSMKVGNLSFNGSRVFHITGLPYEVNFESGDNNSWRKLGQAKHSGSRITIAYTGQGAVRSPAYYIPENINVKTSVDVCTKADKNLYIVTCAKDASSITTGSSYIEPHKIRLSGSLASKGYKECTSVFTLTSSNPSMMYSADAPWPYNIAIYKIKIQYN